MDTTYFMKMSHAQAAMKAADEIYALRQRIAAMTEEVDHHKRWVSVMTEESYALKHKCEQLRQRVQELTAERDGLLAAAIKAADEIRKCDYTPARSTLLVAIASVKGKQND